MPGLATNLVRECLRIRPDDNVTIFLYPHNIPLAEDLSRECFRVGADVNLSLYTDRFYEDYMKLLPEDSLTALRLLPRTHGALDRGVLDRVRVRSCRVPSNPSREDGRDG